eukprot:280179-Alexandrium_andersonii.AAC.1
MRRAFEARWWRLEDSEVPSRTYLEKRLEKLERGELQAEALTAAASHEEEDGDTLTPVWSRS